MNGDWPVTGGEFHEMVLRVADTCDLDVGQLGRRLMF
jgi:hypothetical protein